MAFSSGTEGYYKKMLELQEKLRKSEEERFKLEEKFNEMMQMARDAEHERLRILRHKYHRFLEQDKIRQERNENILRMLDRIENRARMLAAKTERFKTFRKQYESYIRRLNASKMSDNYSQHSSPKITQEKPQNHQTYPGPRKKLFADMPSANNSEEKLAMLEKFLRDNFQNIPIDLNVKTKENILRENRVYNGQHEPSVPPLHRRDSLINKDSFQVDQSYIEPQTFETIDSDSKESQEYPESVYDIQQQKEFHNYKKPMQQKLKYSDSPTKKSVSLGNAIEKQLEKLYSKNVKDNDEVDAYVQNYKDIVTKSEQKFGIKEGAANVNQKVNSNDNLTPIERANYRSEESETKLKFDNENISFNNDGIIVNESKKIDSDNENPVIKKYKEIAKAPIANDTNINEIETKLTPAKINEYIAKKPEQYGEYSNENSFKDTNTEEMQNISSNVQNEKNYLIDSQLEQKPSEEAEFRNVESVEHNLTAKYVNNEEYDTEQSHKDTGEYPSEYRESQYIQEEPRSRKQSVVQQAIDGNTSEYQHSRISPDELSQTLNQEVNGTPVNDVEKVKYEELGNQYTEELVEKVEIHEGAPEEKPADEQTSMQATLEEQQNVQEKVDENYVPEETAFQNESNYKMYENQDYPTDQQPENIYQQSYDENFSAEELAAEQGAFPEQINDPNYQQEHYIEPDYQQGYENQQYDTLEQYPQQQEYQSQDQYQEDYPPQNYPQDQQYNQEYPEQNYQEYVPQPGEYDQQSYPENYNPDQQYINSEDVQYTQEQYPQEYNENMYQTGQDYLQGEQNVDVQYQSEQIENVQSYPAEYAQQEYEGFAEQPYQEGAQEVSAVGQKSATEAQEAPVEVQQPSTDVVEPLKEINKSSEESTSESTVKSSSQKNLEEKPLVEKTLPNLAEMLDTDTESIKQETKISNDSDFDFSNG